MERKVFEGALNSNTARDYYMNKVMKIANDLCDFNFTSDGGYLVSENGLYIISIYDYIEEYWECEYSGTFERHIKQIIGDILDNLED